MREVTPVAIEYVPTGWRYWTEEKRYAAIKAARGEFPGAICFRSFKGIRVILAMHAPTIADVCEATARLESAAEYATIDYMDPILNMKGDGNNHAQA